MKTNQQKENGRTSPSTTSNSTESDLNSASSTNIEEIDEELAPSIEQGESISSTLDDEDSTEKVLEDFSSYGEPLIPIDRLSTGRKQSFA